MEHLLNYPSDYYSWAKEAPWNEIDEDEFIEEEDEEKKKPKKDT